MHLPMHVTSQNKKGKQAKFRPGLFQSAPAVVPSSAAEDDMDDFFEHMAAGSDITLCWTGNDGWLIGSGGHMIATDLDFHSDLRIRPSAISLEKVAQKLDFLFVTHEHGDHFNPDTCRFLHEKGTCRFVLPTSCRRQAIQAGLNEERIVWAKPGEACSLAGWLEFSAIRAIHGHERHSVYAHANLEDCGYILSFCGKRIMQPGDTVLLQEHLETAGIDVLFVSPTEHNTHIEGSVVMIESIKPLKIFAQHFNTYRVDEKNAFWTRGYPEILFDTLPLRLQERFTIPDPDEVFCIGP